MLLTGIDLLVGIVATTLSLWNTAASQRSILVEQDWCVEQKRNARTTFG
jgi:hypothetical protein